MTVETAIGLIINILEQQDKKLNWIAHRLMKLTLSAGEGMTGEEVNEYTRLFKNEK